MKRRVVLLTVALLICYSYFPTQVNAQFIVPAGPKNGPYVDKLVYKVIVGDDQQVLALQNNEIDLIGDMFDPMYLPILESAEYIQVDSIPRNGYGYILINCAKYPFNITEFRRACAFAFDKIHVSETIWQDYSEPQDSLLPKTNPYSIEGQLDYDYYDANYDYANHLLDIAGFTDIDEDGFRECPDGSDLSILLEPALSSNIAILVCDQFVSDMTGIGLNITLENLCFCSDILQRLYFHGDYDMAFLGTTFETFDITWIAREYGTNYVDEVYINLPNWSNASFDGWIDQLLHATSYEDVLDASYAMQEIWVHSSPAIICYENSIFSAYRTDKFTGFVSDYSRGIPCWWTNYKVHLMPSEPGAPWGGEFRWSNGLDLESFNFMTSQSAYTMNSLQMLYDSLMRTDSQGNDMLWLATNYIAETHLDNPSVPIGHTRFTFDIIDNATWTDGTPLTGADIAYSLNYYRDAPGNPYGASLSEMVSAYAPTQFRIIVEFDSESFWHLNSVAYKPIIPKHVFLDIGIENWNTWNPQPVSEEMVTSGPFNITDYVAGEYIELTFYPDYFFMIEREEKWPCFPCCGSICSTFTSETFTTMEFTTTHTISISETSIASSLPSTENTLTTDQWTQLATYLGFAVTLGSLAVIVVFSILIIKNRTS